jgi:hypothetical protein
MPFFLINNHKSYSLLGRKRGKTEGRKQKAESRRQKTEGRWQNAEGSWRSVSRTQITMAID